MKVIKYTTLMFEITFILARTGILFITVIDNCGIIIDLFICVSLLKTLQTHEKSPPICYRLSDSFFMANYDYICMIRILWRFLQLPLSRWSSISSLVMVDVGHQLQDAFIYKYISVAARPFKKYLMTAVISALSILSKTLTRS